MVHRDIKPHNLLVNRKGHLKILDFGLARLSADPSSGQVVSTAGLTNPSFVLGTPDFVAPEQARDSTAVDIRADLYSLGCTLYYLLTGKPPYPTGSVIEKLFQHCESCPPRASDLRSDIPAEVESVLQKLLAKNPDDRYQTPAELAQALAPLIRPGSGTTPTNRTMPVIAASPPRSETRAIRRPLAAGAPEEVVVTEPVAKPSKLTRKSKSKKQRKKAFPLPIVPLILLLALPLLGYAGYRAAAPWISKLTADAATSKTPPPGEPVVNRPLPEMTPGPSSTAPPRSQDASPSSSSGPMVLLVVPHRGLWHADYHPVKALLDKAGYHTETVSSEYGVCQAYPAPGNDGPDVLPQNLITNVHPPMYEAVVFVGATTSAFEDSSTPAGRATRQLIEVLTKAGKPVSAICAGQKVLVSQGYLKGKSAARNQYTVEHPGADTVNWIDTAVKQDGNIITGADADAAEPFVKTLITAMRQGSGEKSISPAGAAKPPSASPGPKLSEYGPPPFTPPPPPRPRFQPGQKPPPGSFFPRQKPPMGQGRASD
jgi:putative intracellular protease/amidase